MQGNYSKITSDHKTAGFILEYLLFDFSHQKDTYVSKVLMLKLHSPDLILELTSYRVVVFTVALSSDLSLLNSVYVYIFFWIEELYIINWNTMIRKSGMHWLVNSTMLVCDADQWLSGRFSALHFVVAGSISCGGDHGIHCWWDLLRLKQVSSVSICYMHYLPDFLIIVIQFISVLGGACVVIVIILGNGHGNTSSNTGWSWLDFTQHSYPWKMYESNHSPSSYG